MLRHTSCAGPAWWGLASRQGAPPVALGAPDRRLGAGRLKNGPVQAEQFPIESATIQGIGSEVGVLALISVGDHRPCNR